jgi:hypothetical protein
MFRHTTEKGDWGQNRSSLAIPVCGLMTGNSEVMLLDWSRRTPLW